MVCREAHDVERNVYDNFDQLYMDPEYLRQRAILSRTNDVIQQYNSNMVETLPGTLFESRSIDECIEDDDKKKYDIETLNRINSSGIPPHNSCV